jgi:hypothetical protein
MPDESTTPQAASADVETLARSFMGWKRGREVYPDDAAGPLDWYFQHNGTWWRKTDWLWNPLTDANADLQVLERVREVWFTPEATRGNPHLWPCERFKAAFERICETRKHYAAPWYLRYAAGNYSRTALAVLREMEETNK